MTEQVGTGPVEGLDVDLGSGGRIGSTDTAAADQWVPYDSDDDGYAEMLTRAFDGGFEVIVDADLDGTADDAWAADSNGDGVLDVQVLRTGDTYLVRYDADADSVFEYERELTLEELVREAPSVAEVLGVAPSGGSEDPTQVPKQETTGPDPSDVEPSTGDSGGDPSPEPDGYVVDGQLVGDPADAAENWFQQAANGFCVPASVAQIVAEYTGDPVMDEQEFVTLANELHLFTVGPDGVPSMTQSGALQLLEAAGVPAELVYADTSSLEGYLAEGRGVMAFVDSGELWYGEDVEDETVDHAVLVTGVDRERGVVYLSDPGDPEGNAKEYPLSLFEDAWADGGGQALVCDEPAPDDGSGRAVGAGRELEESGSPVQVTTSKLVDGAWALLPVVLRGRP